MTGNCFINKTLLEEANDKFKLQEDGFTVLEKEDIDQIDSKKAISNIFFEYLIRHGSYQPPNSKVIIGLCILDEELGITRDKILVSAQSDGKLIMI